MGIFDQVDLEINKVKDKQVFVRFKSGVSTAKVVETGAMRTFKGKNPMYTVKFEVVSTTDPDLQAGTIVDYAKNPVTDWGVKEVRAFLVAACGFQPGLDDEKIAATDWLKVLRDTSNSPKLLTGSVVEINAQGAVGQDSGRAYTKLSFTTTPATRSKRLEHEAKQAAPAAADAKPAAKK